MTTHVIVVPQTRDVAVTVSSGGKSRTFVVPQSCVRHLVVVDDGSYLVLSEVLAPHLAGPLESRPLPTMQQDEMMDDVLLGRSH